MIEQLTRFAPKSCPRSAPSRSRAHGRSGHPGRHAALRHRRGRGRADLAVRDGRISAITPRTRRPARRVIDARGLTIAPGFIDIKTHSDFTLPLTPPGAESKIRQGVTTEVIGHCGLSVASGRAGPGAGLSRENRRASPRGSRARETYVRRLPGRLPGNRGEHDHAGRPQHAPADDGRDGRSRADRGTRWPPCSASWPRGSRRAPSGCLVRPVHRPGLLRPAGRAARPAGRGQATRRSLRDAHRERAGTRSSRRSARRSRPPRQSGVHVQIVHMKLSGLDNRGSGRAAPRRDRRGAAPGRPDRLRRLPVHVRRRTRSATCSRCGSRRAAASQPMLGRLPRPHRPAPRRPGDRRARAHELRAHRLVGRGERRHLADVDRWTPGAPSPSWLRARGRGADRSRLRSPRGRTRAPPSWSSAPSTRPTSRRCSARPRSWSARTAARSRRTAGGTGPAASAVLRDVPAGARPLRADLGLLSLPEAVHKMTGAPVAGLQPVSTAGSCARATAPTSPRSTPPRSSTARPTTIRIAIRRASRRSSSTGPWSSTRGSIPARGRGGCSVAGRSGSPDAP